MKEERWVRRNRGGADSQTKDEMAKKGKKEMKEAGRCVGS